MMMYLLYAMYMTYSCHCCAFLEFDVIRRKFLAHTANNRLRKFSREIFYCVAITITRNMCAENLLLEFDGVREFFLSLNKILLASGRLQAAKEMKTRNFTILSIFSAAISKI